MLSDAKMRPLLSTRGLLTLGSAPLHATAPNILTTKALLHVSTSGVSSATEVLTVSTAPSAKAFVVKGDGKVGIRTSVPGAQLDVVGNAAFGSGGTKSTFTASGFWEPYSRTRAQIDVLVPTKIGQVIYASDSTLPGLCISTETLAGDWRKMESATLGCGTNN